MTSRLDGELELGPDAVIRGNEQGIAIARGLQVEKSPESAELGVGSRPRSRFSERPNRFYQRVSGIYRNARVGISQGLLAHREGALETSRLDFHAVVAKRPRECSATVLSPSFCCWSLSSDFRPCFMASWRAGIAESCPSTAQAHSRSVESMSTSAAQTRRR